MTSAIYGIFGEADVQEVRAMGRRLQHRGTEGDEWFVSPIAHFGQRRRTKLSGLFVPPPYPIVFDGTLDNTDEIVSLLGWSKKETTVADDAHLVFELFRKFGPDVFGNLNGQFALAVWDAENRTLVLARDGWGSRSLYFAHINGRYLFASEYKALLVIEELPARPNRDVIQHIQCTKHAVAQACCLADVHPVPAGSWIRLGHEAPFSRRCWDVKIDITSRSLKAHANALRTTLLDAVSRQISRYEVIGVALSGGLDAAVTLAAIHHLAPEKVVHTFTAGSGREDGDMIGAAAVAKHFNTHHHEILLDSAELPAVLAPMVWHMEDPVGGDERLVQYRTAREAAKHVEILFSGHKSDNLFAGMPRHKVVKAAILVPAARIPLEEFFGYTQTGTPARNLLARALIAWYYKGKQIPPPRVQGVTIIPANPVFPLDSAQPLSALLRRGILDDANTNSATERLHSAFAVEWRSPYMDLKVTACAFRMPDRAKIRGTREKYILRRAFEGLLPDVVLKRKKRLQRLKQDKDLTDTLDLLAEQLLPANAVASRGLFEPAYVARVRRRPRSGIYATEQAYRLWSLILTEIWCQLYLDGRGAPPRET